MHLLTTPLLYRILTFQSTPQYTKLIGIILSILFIIVMVVHMVMDEFLLHAVSFGSAVLLITIRTLKIIPTEITDERARGTVKRVALFGVGMYHLFLFILSPIVYVNSRYLFIDDEEINSKFRLRILRLAH